MYRISFTHIFDCLYKIIILAGIVFFIGLLCRINLYNLAFGSLNDLLYNSFLFSSGFKWLGYACIGFLYLAMVATAIFLLLLCAQLLKATILPHWLPTYLYVRTILYTKITTQEADAISFLFDGSLENEEWYPLKEIQLLPTEERRPILFNFALLKAASYNIRLYSEEYNA